MKRAMLIPLSLVLALVGSSTVGAQDEFYVISGVKRNYAPVPKTGQTTSYAFGIDDGGYQKGVASPTPRFTDNGNGTVTDKLTGLIWMQDANAFGTQTWASALFDAYDLKSGTGGLTDGSKQGDWRLPNIRELLSLIDFGSSTLLFPAGNPFKNNNRSPYWSSTTLAASTNYSYDVGFILDGSMTWDDKSSKFLCGVCEVHEAG
jgi:hypothetical protein